jgi:glycosyltransferase involved in cell wall biosynthesis
MKKKIALILNGVWLNSKSMSGGDIRFFELCSRLFNKKEVYCITNKKGNSFLKKELNKINYIITPNFFDYLTLMPSYILRTIYATFKMWKHKFEFIYSSSDTFPNVIPCYFAKNKHNKWVQVIHHIYEHWNTRQGNKIVNFVSYNLQKMSFILIKKKADRIILVNNLVREELIRKGFKKEKMFISYNGINLDYFNEIKKTNNEYNSIFLGRLNYSKGVFDLIKIWKEVTKKIPEAKLGIIGGGSEKIKEKLKKEIKINNLEKNVDLLGYLDNKKTFGILKNSNLFISASHEEGWGISISEAMACKVPVIVWDLPIYSEIYKDKIIQVKENEVNNFAKKIVELLKNKEKREDLSKEGYELIKKYSWKNVAKRENEILDGIKQT